MAQKKALEHWPVIALIAVFAVVFLTSTMLFQVQTTEYAVVKRFGSPIPGRATTPGLHWKLPPPIEEVWSHDNRVQIFEGKSGKVEEVFTKDGKNIVVTLYIGWCVSSPSADRIKFMETVASPTDAEAKLTGLMSNYKHTILGEYNFSDLINTDPKAVKIGEIEDRLRDSIGKVSLSQFGIEVKFVGIKFIGLPESVTQKVFERMKAEREAIATNITSKGKAEADAIRAEADKERQSIIQEAQAEAKAIRAKAAVDTAQSYAVFKENEQLAIFLRQLDAIRTTLSSKTTLVFDTQTPPFDIFSANAYSALKSSTLPVPVAPTATQPKSEGK